MINPLLTTHAWAMHEPALKALVDRAEQAEAFDDDSATDASDEYQIVNGVAVMSLCGPMVKYNDIWTTMFGGSSTLDAKQNLQDALDNPNVTATLLIVDSPGGMVAGTGDLADTIANADKPVWVYISDQCASAAYWVASQADKVFCNATASVGSIGVYCVIEDTSQLYEDAGVKVHLIKAGAFKGTGVDGVPVTDDQIAEEQREVDEIYSLFVNAVASGRKMTNSQAAQLATGQMWIASKAKDLGLVDGIASLDDCFAQLSGEMMAKRNSAFSVSRAAGKADKVSQVAEEVVEDKTVEQTVETPANETTDKAEDQKVEAEKPQAESDKPEMIEVEKSKFEAVVADSVAVDEQIKKAHDQGFDEGVKDERARLASLREIAPEHPQFVLEQFAAGAERGSAAVAFAQLLQKELKEARAKISLASTEGAKAVAIGSVEGRAEKDKPRMSLIKFKK